MALTTANPSMSSILPGYDPVSQQENVAVQVTPAFTDPVTGVKYGPLLIDQIRAAIIAGQGFAVSTGLVTGTLGTQYAGVQILGDGTTNTKNILVYNAYGTTAGNASVDIEIRQGTANTVDSTLTGTPTVLNMGGSANTPIATVKVSPAAPTTTAPIGSLRGFMSIGANSVQEYLLNGGIFFLPRLTVGYIVFYQGVGVTAFKAAVSVEWLEF
jgi:hypothetical protein